MMPKKIVGGVFREGITDDTPLEDIDFTEDSNLQETDHPLDSEEILASETKEVDVGSDDNNQQAIEKIDYLSLIHI